ncbi:hypothetical protein AB9M62_57355 [Bacillales bacterium AN1005]
MLSDYERKVLRILYNYSVGRRRFPTIHELTVKTGKHTPDVLAALNGLIKLNYITWDDRTDTSSLVIIEGWERENERPKVEHVPTSSSSTPKTNLDYWTQY